MDLMESLDCDNCPLGKSERPRYKYADHSTTISRAGAWFNSSAWPRRGIDVDNFIDSNTYQSFDGSHLCHHDNCINPLHLLYEPTWVNFERIECKQHAISLRSQGKPIPERCSKHEVGCLMQVSNIATLYSTCSKLMFWLVGCLDHVWSIPHSKVETSKISEFARAPSST